LLTLHRDVAELVGRSAISYTPTLLVSYGGPFTESYFYTRENPHRDPKLRRFTPDHVLASRTLRGPWFMEEEYVFPELAEQAAKIVRAGGRVGVGGHGQLQGLGFHWELWALAHGLSNWEALTAATRQGAEIVGVAEDLGTLEVGKLADLVVLKENPLDDIRHSNSIEYVMKNGELFEGDTLDQIHPVERPLPEQWWWNTGPPQMKEDSMSKDSRDDIDTLMHTAYAAFNRRDIDGAVAVMTEDVAWSNGWEGGYVHGHDGVRDYWTRQWAELDPTVTPVAITTLDDGRVVVRVEQVIRRPDGSLVRAGPVDHVYTLRDGRVAQMDIVAVPAPE
jgi:ketosteroid isomerase-like protein